MDSTKKKNYVRKLLSTFKEVNAPLSAGIEYDIMNAETGSYVFNLTSVNDVLSDLLTEEEWGTKFTQETIQKELKNLLYRAFEAGEERWKKASEYFDELVQFVEEFSLKHQVYIPTGNIQMELDELQIGNITLLKNTSEQAEKVKNHVTILLGVKSPQETNEPFWGVLGVLNTEVYAKYTCIAEPERAVERANEEFQRVLDLLRYTIYMKEPGHKSISIGRYGDATKGFSETLAISADNNEDSFFTSQLIGSHIPFIIKKETREAMEEIGIFKVGAILEQPANLKQKSKEATFDEMLLRSLRWFSNAQIQTLQENKFLNLMSCLETFLTSGGRGTITNSFAEGIAFVLGSNMAHRKQLRDKIRTLYKNRSNISHGGHSAMLQSDLDDLQHIAAEFLEVMIHNKNNFKTQKDLFDWIEDQKFSTPETTE